MTVSVAHALVSLIVGSTLGGWPLNPQPVVVRGFDPPSSSFTAGHRGVDLLGSPGQPVRASLPGTILYAARLAGRGVMVVGHGQTRTTYEPVTATAHVGEVVARGQQIGTLAGGPSHCAPQACLHWGWLRGQIYLDPLTLVGDGPIRLKPWQGLPGAGLMPLGGPADRQRATAHC